MSKPTQPVSSSLYAQQYHSKFTLDSSNKMPKAQLIPLDKKHQNRLQKNPAFIYFRKKSPIVSSSVPMCGLALLTQECPAVLC